MEVNGASEVGSLVHQVIGKLIHQPPVGCCVLEDHGDLPFRAVPCLIPKPCGFGYGIHHSGAGESQAESDLKCTSRRAFLFFRKVVVKVSHVEDGGGVIRAVPEGVAFVKFVFVDFRADTVLDELFPGGC